MIRLNSALVEEYERLYETLEIKPDCIDDVDRLIDKILDNKPYYKIVEKATTVPWFVITAIHSLESSADFTKHLHNGDPLIAKTVNVPAGRPLRNPPFTWTESAIDALELKDADTWPDWTLAGICYFLERYNGWGYRLYNPKVKSPYMWSFSNHYTKGKYGADGKFDPNLVSQQIGGMVLLKRMEQEGLIDLGEPEFPPVTWIGLYRKEENNTVFPVATAWANSELIEVVELKDRSNEDLADFLRKYPTAKTFQVACNEPPSPDKRILLPTPPPLPTLRRIFSWGDKGEDVKALQKALNYLGFNSGAVDGDFGDQTEAAVKAFQLRKDLLVDGEVGPITWKALGGDADIPDTPKDVHLKLAQFASTEASKNLRWSGVNSEAEKYLKIFRPIMQELGHIGTKPIFYDWCAAFVTYCCFEVGIDIPYRAKNYWASMALVASWEYWAKQKGYWYSPRTTKPQRGDIVLFNFAARGLYNHIGIVRGYTPNSSVFRTAEGNVGNRSGLKTRSLSLISGLVRIR
ncbi:MAG: peptidoglycan-binding protein [Cyanobacteria bacterium P01_D01_bin.116]